MLIYLKSLDLLDEVLNILASNKNVNIIIDDTLDCAVFNTLYILGCKTIILQNKSLLDKLPIDYVVDSSIVPCSKVKTPEDIKLIKKINDLFYKEFNILEIEVHNNKFQDYMKRDAIKLSFSESREKYKKEMKKTSSAKKSSVKKLS